MDGTKDSHHTQSKSERPRQIPCDNTYMWNLKYSTNELIYKIDTDSHRGWTRGCQGEARQKWDGLGVWG